MPLLLNLHPVAWRGKVMPLNNSIPSSPAPNPTLLFFPFIILLIRPSLLFSLSPLSRAKHKTLLNGISLPLFTLFYFAFLGHLISSHGFNPISLNLPPTTHTPCWIKLLPPQKPFGTFYHLLERITIPRFDTPDPHQFPPPYSHLSHVDVHYFLTPSASSCSYAFTHSRSTS